MASPNAWGLIRFAFVNKWSLADAAEAFELEAGRLPAAKQTSTRTDATPGQPDTTFKYHPAAAAAAAAAAATAAAAAVAEGEGASGEKRLRDSKAVCEGKNAS